MKAVFSAGRVAQKRNCHHGKSSGGFATAGRSKFRALKHKDKRALPLFKFANEKLPQFRGLMPDETLVHKCPYQYVHNFLNALRRAADRKFSQYYAGSDSEFLKLLSADAKYAVTVIESGVIERLEKIAVSL